MIQTILYFHGFASSSESSKAQIIKKYISSNYKDIKIYTPNLSNNFKEAIEQIENLVKQNENIAFMGCSLGGYYALYFSQLHKSKAILINPAIPPLEGFEVYLGENENFSTREKFSITKKDIKYIRSISHDSFNNKKRTLVLLESEDEVLDYIKTISYFKGSHIDILFGGNHSYSSFENKLVKIHEFLQIH